MKTIRLGKTGLEVSRVGFGGIPILRMDEVDAIDLVRYAIDQGITFFDTANAYTSSKTSSEELIGKGVANRREEVIIATKSSVRTMKGAQKHLELSLKRLSTDYIDIWQFHGVNNEKAYKRLMKKDGAMVAAKAALETGTIRHTLQSLDLRSGIFCIVSSNKVTRPESDFIRRSSFRKVVKQHLLCIDVWQANIYVRF